MCGIAGLFDPQGLRPFDPSLIRRINDVQAHRGPDSDGTERSSATVYG